MPFRLRRRRVENLSLADPATAAILGAFGGAFSGEVVSEDTALTLSAFWRGSMLIAETIGTLPLKSYRTTADDERERVTSILDNPAGPDAMTPMEWKATNVLHLVLHGEAPLLHRRNEGGALVGYEPIHPLALSIKHAPRELSGPGKKYPDGKIYTLATRTPLGTAQPVDLTSKDITVIPGPISNGLRGMSFLSFGRNSLSISLAGEKAAAKMFKNGAQINGVLVPGDSENLSLSDIEALRADLDQNLFGVDNAGSVPIVNKVLKFAPWQMTNLDAQFLESRQFQVEEAARWLGVPPHLLMQGTAVSNWGTGVAQQNKNLAQYVLRPWTKRIEERLSRNLPSPRFCEFDMAGLESGSAADESALLLSQVNGGLITPNEARRIKNLPPVDGGDVLRVPSGVKLSDELAAEAAAAQTDGTSETTEKRIP